MALKDIAIARKQPEESTLDKIAKGLSIAQSVAGTAVNVKDIMMKIDAQKQADIALAAEKQRAAEGGISQKTYEEVVSKGGKFTPALPEDAGAVKMPSGKFGIPSIPQTTFQQEGLAMRQEALRGQQEERTLKREEQKIAKEEKQQAKVNSLTIPGYGIAANEDDAKKLKDALIQKKNLDDTLDRIIELRQSKGAEIWDREAVAEAKQLATDAKLTAKNIAKLGVMSASDEKMLNQIVPEDPTEWKVASLVGQDPVLTSLQKYKEQSAKKFDNEINARLKGGAPKEAAPPTAPTKEDVRAELVRRGLIK